MMKEMKQPQHCEKRVLDVNAYAIAVTDQEEEIYTCAYIVII